MIKTNSCPLFHKNHQQKAFLIQKLNSQLIATFVLWMIIVTFYPFKIDLVLTINFQKTLPQIRVFLPKNSFFSQPKTNFFSTKSITYFESEITKTFIFGFLSFSKRTITPSNSTLLLVVCLKLRKTLFCIPFRPIP